MNEKPYKPSKDYDETTLLNKKKNAARQRVGTALKNGKIKKLSCEYADCKNEKTEAHHPDYDFPLDVIWLCRQHHDELHHSLRFDSYKQYTALDQF